MNKNLINCYRLDFNIKFPEVVLNVKSKSH